ncbi:unnamed protein product [Mortierella alpina]
MLRNANGYSDYQPVTPPGDKPLPVIASPIAVAGGAVKASPVNNNSNSSNINCHGQLNRTPSLDGTTIRGSPPNNTINTQNMTSASSTNMTSHTLHTNNTAANHFNNSSASLVEVKKNSNGSDTGRGSPMEGIQRASPVEILRVSPPVEASNNLNQNYNPNHRVSSPFEAGTNKASPAVERSNGSVSPMDVHQGSPFENAKVTPFEVGTGSPFEAPRGPLFEAPRGSTAAHSNQVSNNNTQPSASPFGNGAIQQSQGLQNQQSQQSQHYHQQHQNNASPQTYFNHVNINNKRGGSPFEVRASPVEVTKISPIEPMRASPVEVRGPVQPAHPVQAQHGHGAPRVPGQGAAHSPLGIQIALQAPQGQQSPGQQPGLAPNEQSQIHHQQQFKPYHQQEQQHFQQHQQQQQQQQQLQQQQLLQQRQLQLQQQQHIQLQQFQLQHQQQQQQQQQQQHQQQPSPQHHQPQHQQQQQPSPQYQQQLPSPQHQQQQQPSPQHQQQQQQPSPQHQQQQQRQQQPQQYQPSLQHQHQQSPQQLQQQQHQQLQQQQQQHHQQQQLQQLQQPRPIQPEQVMGGAPLAENRGSPPQPIAAAAIIRGFQTIERHVDESLEHETEETLLGRIKADIVVMCQERGLPAEGEKKALIQALLDWQKAKPVPGPSTPKLCSIQPAIVVQNKAPINTKYLNSLLQDGNFQGEIMYEQLTVGKKLGSGGFKDCYAGTYMGEAVAIGELRVQNFTEMDIQEMKHEINVLKQLRHENIIRFIGVCTNIKHLCIVTELCENGDLYDFMRKTKKPTFGRLIMYMHDIALACAYLHTRRPSIIHRDMKSMNVLISSDDRAKINDFGLARIRPRANASLHTQCGTPNWQAPEFWSPNPSYTEKVDVYACGLIYWEILSWAELGYPYHNLTEHQLYEAVRDKEERPPLEKLKKYPQSLLSLIQDMWRKDPKKRPSMSYVVDRLAEYLE